MAEWFKAPVSKTGDPEIRVREFKSHSFRQYLVWSILVDHWTAHTQVGVKLFSVRLEVAPTGFKFGKVAEWSKALPC